MNNFFNGNFVIADFNCKDNFNGLYNINAQIKTFKNENELINFVTTNYPRFFDKTYSNYDLECDALMIIDLSTAKTGTYKTSGSDWNIKNGPNFEILTIGTSLKNICKSFSFGTSKNAKINIFENLESEDETFGFILTIK